MTVVTTFDDLYASYQHCCKCTFMEIDGLFRDYTHCKPLPHTRQ